MKNIISILILIIAASFVSQGQVTTEGKAFNELSYKIVLLEELKSDLLTGDFENKKSIFIQADTNYIKLV